MDLVRKGRFLKAVTNSQEDRRGRFTSYKERSSYNFHLLDYYIYCVGLNTRITYRGQSIYIAPGPPLIIHKVNK